MSYSVESARELALNALLYIAGDPELIAAFLSESGLQASALRTAAARPEFQPHVLDFLLAADARVIGFVEAQGIRPEEVMIARTVLAGPGSFGWEAD